MEYDKINPKFKVGDSLCVLRGDNEIYILKRKVTAIRVNILKDGKLSYEYRTTDCGYIGENEVFATHKQAADYYRDRMVKRFEGAGE